MDPITLGTLIGTGTGLISNLFGGKKKKKEFTADDLAKYGWEDYDLNEANDLLDKSGAGFIQENRANLNDKLASEGYDPFAVATYSMDAPIYQNLLTEKGGNYDKFIGSTQNKARTLAALNANQDDEDESGIFDDMLAGGALGLKFGKAYRKNKGGDIGALGSTMSLGAMLGGTDGGNGLDEELKQVIQELEMAKPKYSEAWDNYNHLKSAGSNPADLKNSYDNAVNMDSYIKGLENKILTLQRRYRENTGDDNVLFRNQGGDIFGGNMFSGSEDNSGLDEEIKMAMQELENAKPKHDEAWVNYNRLKSAGSNDTDLKDAYDNAINMGDYIKGLENKILTLQRRYRETTGDDNVLMRNRGGNITQGLSSLIMRMDSGGSVPKNRGVPGKDSVPVLATPGEKMINAEASSLYGPWLDKMNKVGLKMRDVMY